MRRRNFWTNVSASPFWVPSLCTKTLISGYRGGIKNIVFFYPQDCRVLAFVVWTLLEIFWRFANICSSVFRVAVKWRPQFPLKCRQISTIAHGFIPTDGTEVAPFTYTLLSGGGWRRRIGRRKLVLFWVQVGKAEETTTWFQYCQPVVWLIDWLIDWLINW